ncbi:hypothetical protein DRE_01753 [Drechslerella stenobrocha 248]|uniref:Nudix hydrolase domain-containing protein n=1 Tax=Drechslerella stenobrocha 248 TaxID=1043628 RepID=W7HWK7_9PEZI|nr:hypothetical protein DRE_01753 [Drechslerella stenobrocha 248]
MAKKRQCKDDAQKTDATFDEVLSDLGVRFVVNLPQEELVSRERVCFQIEEAHWYYEDFIREQRPEFPGLSLPTFLGKIFAHNPMLNKWGMHQDAYREFMEYKHRVPVRGGILLNPAMDKVVLVKGWKAGASWAFPRGKINKDEPDHICAVREVLEETGFDASELIDPKSFLVDVEENGDRHLQLYLIKNVPEDFKFHPLARKEISEVAWFPIQELQAQSHAHRKRREQARNNQKTGEPEPERGPDNKLRVYKIYGFLPGMARWIKEQRRQVRQQERNRRQGQVYETEPESSAFEASPPRKPRTVGNTTSPFNEPVAITNLVPQRSEPRPGPAVSSSTQAELASAKLREMIGVGSTPAAEGAPRHEFDKTNASRSLLAQLQTPTHHLSAEEPAAGRSLSLSALFEACKQESKPVNRKAQEGSGHLEPGQLSNHTPRSSNLNPPAPRGGHGARNGYRQQASVPEPHRDARSQNGTKPLVTILQRGQPLPDSVQKTPKTISPVLAAHPSVASIAQPPSTPPTVQSSVPRAVQAPSVPPVTQPSFAPPAVQPSLAPLAVPPSQPATIQSDVSSPNAKMARRPLLTIDSFTPPNPSQSHSQEHRGNLLDILKGAKPPPTAQPVMQLDPVAGNKDVQPTVLSLGDILAGKGVKFSQQAIPTPTQPAKPEPRPLLTPQHSSRLMTVTPPATISSQRAPDNLPRSVENQPAHQPHPAKSVQQAQTAMSPISPVQNGFTPSPTTSVSTAAHAPGTTGSTNKVPAFDRRLTVKPEQAKTLLGLFKLSTAEDTVAPAPVPVLSPQVQAVPRNYPPAEKPDDLVAPQMHRSESLSVEQRAMLMNILNTLATQHGV